MNWFDNVSSDCDQPIAPARLVQGHWRHALHAYAEPALCRVVIDVAEPRVVAAQVIENGLSRDLGASVLEELTQAILAQEVHHHPSAWGLSECTMLPNWARPTFSERQIEELERIEGYLIEASEDTVDSVLKLRDEFLKSIGLTDLDIYRAVRQPQQGQVVRKSSRMLIN
ncbi:MAG: hypothetical protein HY019_01280 [Aquabacterium sp.]|uniref:hypothetical protein n=1 Tax=Aquabacterium sp. TaxID=1872578 RepID=UPI0025B8C7E4|nr:hypothetical protein [Aquabacterium sp.]MBI3380613.1 hypothetical protein [Aquabacterium sp.]